MFEFESIRLKAGMKVMTPMGVARVTDRAVIPGEPDGVMVVLDRKDFSKDEWAAITPHNDPCVFRIYPPDKVTLLEAAIYPQVLREIDAMLPAPDAEMARSVKSSRFKRKKS